MQLSNRKERFSLAYIGAVAARAGYQIAEPSVDDDSVDGVLIASTGRRPRVEFQAKASAMDITRPDHIAFQISRKNYNDLRADCIVPRILVVVLLPRDENQWLEQTEDQMIVRHCGYWTSLAGYPDIDQDSKVIHIPKRQIFNPPQLEGMMNRMQMGERL